jgi:hypothetical protein
MPQNKIILGSSTSVIASLGVQAIMDANTRKLNTNFFMIYWLNFINTQSARFLMWVLGSTLFINNLA